MPIINIVIPEEIGPVEECVVVTWLKREGDRVEQGEDLLILQAEKTSFDIPAPATGTIKAVLVSQGETVKRDQPLAHLAVSETETVAAAAAEPEPESAVPPAAPGDGGRASPLAKKLARQHGLDLSRISGSGSGGRITERDVQAVIEAQTRQTSSVPQKEVLASPVAKRLAREHGLNLADLPTAGSGRITEKEVRAYLETQQPVTAASAPAASRTIPLAGMRGTIARRMQQSLQEMAQLTLHTEVDVTDLVALRERLKSQGPVTYTDLIVKACALALKQHPRLNATVEGDQIKLLADIHMGLAVALDEGLTVPVLRHADRQSLADLARERTRLVEKAKANQLTTPEITGSTFTVTNLGTYEIDAFTPIVNPPEAAILGVGRIVEKVVVYQGKIAQRTMMTLSLSFDHRLVDGAPAAEFLQTIKRQLEQPAALA